MKNIMRAFQLLQNEEKANYEKLTSNLRQMVERSQLTLPLAKRLSDTELHTLSVDKLEKHEPPKTVRQPQCTVICRGGLITGKVPSACTREHGDMLHTP